MNYYDWNSTFKERTEKRKLRVYVFFCFIFVTNYGKSCDFFAARKVARSGAVRSGPVPLVSMVTGQLTGPVTIEKIGDREPDRSGNCPRREKIATFTV